MAGIYASIFCSYFAVEGCRDSPDEALPCLGFATSPDSPASKHALAPVNPVHELPLNLAKDFGRAIALDVLIVRMSKADMTF